MFCGVSVNIYIITVLFLSAAVQVHQDAPELLSLVDNTGDPLVGSAVTPGSGLLMAGRGGSRVDQS